MRYGDDLFKCREWPKVRKTVEAMCRREGVAVEALAHYLIYKWRCYPDDLWRRVRDNPAQLCKVFEGMERDGFREAE